MPQWNGYGGSPSMADRGGVRSSGGQIGGSNNQGMAGSPAGRGVGSSDSTSSSSSSRGDGQSGNQGMAGNPAGQGVGGNPNSGSNSDHGYGGSIGEMAGSSAGRHSESGSDQGGWASGSANAATGTSHYGGFDGANPPSYGPGFTRADHAYNDMVSRGIDPDLAHGMVASLIGENRKLDPNAQNEIGAYGLAQWLGDRKRGLMGEFGQRPSFQNQLDYMDQERLGIAPYNADPGVRAFSAWMDKNPHPTPAAAAEAHMRMFENPGTARQIANNPALARSLRERRATANQLAAGTMGSMFGADASPTLPGAPGQKTYYDRVAPEGIDMERANPIPSPIGFQGYPQVMSQIPGMQINPMAGPAPDRMTSAMDMSRANPVPSPMGQMAQMITQGAPASGAPVAPQAIDWSRPQQLPDAFPGQPAPSFTPSLGTAPINPSLRGQSPSPMGVSQSPEAPISLGSVKSWTYGPTSPAGYRPAPVPGANASPLAEMFSPPMADRGGVRKSMGGRRTVAQVSDRPGQQTSARREKADRKTVSGAKSGERWFDDLSNRPRPPQTISRESKGDRMIPPPPPPAPAPVPTSALPPPVSPQVAALMAQLFANPSGMKPFGKQWPNFPIPQRIPMPANFNPYTYGQTGGERLMYGIPPEMLAMLTSQSAGA